MEEHTHTRRHALWEREKLEILTTALSLSQPLHLGTQPRTTTGSDRDWLYMLLSCRDGIWIIQLTIFKVKRLVVIQMVSKNGQFCATFKLWNRIWILDKMVWFSDAIWVITRFVLYSDPISQPEIQTPESLLIRINCYLDPLFITSE